MRIITRKRITEWCRAHPDAASWLADWSELVRHAQWQSIQDVRLMYPSADAVTVESGSVVTVFNVRGNRYRMIVAIHYNTACVYMLRFMTHAEYSRRKPDWRDSL